MPYMTYPQLKDSARSRLKPVIGSLAGASAIYYGLTIAISQFSSLSGVFTESFALQIILLFLFTIVGTVFSEMLSIGLHYLNLKLYCGRSFSAGDVFYAFTAQTKNALLLSSFMSVISFVPLIPFYIFFRVLWHYYRNDGSGNRTVLLYACAYPYHNTGTCLFAGLLPAAGFSFLLRKGTSSQKPASDARSQGQALLHSGMHASCYPDRGYLHMLHRVIMDHAFCACCRNGILSRSDDKTANAVSDVTRNITGSRTFRE